MPDIAEIVITLSPQLIYFVRIESPDLTVTIPVPLSD